MGKGSILRMFQQARMEEWIGDYEKADLLYEELEESEEGIVKVMRPSIQNKRHFLQDKIKGEHNIDKEIFQIPDASEPKLGWTSSETRSLVNQSKLFNVENLKPKQDYELKENLFVVWKYSIQVVSKFNNELKLEIRGYNPDGQIPVFKKIILNREIKHMLEDWQINVEWSPEDENPDLCLINGYYEPLNIALEIHIDRWGLLSGNMLVSEAELGDSLVTVHLLLSKLSKYLW